MADQTVIDRLRAGGIVSPKVCVAEAERAKLPLHYAAALLDKESGGGHNVFGHDRDRSGKYIFPARDGTVKVTKELYQEYKRRRLASGNKTMQGVGPCQLTWFSFQDDADKEGGCWKPHINMRIGFRRLADLMHDHGESVGARMYNGSGDAAVAYSADLLKRAAAWKVRLGGAAPAPAPSHDGHRRGPAPARGGPLQRGDRGPKVIRLTRRLARTRSKAGTRYLSKPRAQFDATAEAALKAFQAEHRLEPDGIFGPVSQRKLNRVVRLQQTKAEPAAKVATAEPAKRPRARLKALVDEVHRYDAETGEAWDALVAHAMKRKRALVSLAAKEKAGGPLASTVADGFAAVTAALKEIDGTLDTMVAAEAGAPAASVTAAEPVAAPAAVAASGGGAPPVAVAASGGGVPPVADVIAATVTQAAAPPPPPAEGPAPPSPAAGAAPAPARRELDQLSDEELLERIARLDRSLDRARALMIRRFATVEKEVVRLAPQKREHAGPDGGSGAGAGAAEPVRRRRPKPEPPPRRPAHTGPRTMSHDQVKGLQKALNTFTENRLKGSVGPLMTDGVMGHATKKRIREAKYYLGYNGADRKSAKVDSVFMRRLRHPRSARFSNPAMLTRAADRRRKERKGAKLSMTARSGVATFDGKPVAAWLQPYLVWARNNGWQGTLNSGWRDPAYSEQLCRKICGAPTCPGRCAGRTSNHAGSVKPAGAVDVSDYGKFGVLMRRCPLEPRIFNALGARDPVHFSASGR